jgi:type II secretory pathway component PulF
MGFSYSDPHFNLKSEKKPFKIFDFSFIKDLFKRKPSLKELYSFFMELSAYVNASYPLDKAFDILAEQESNPMLKKSLKEMSLSLQDSNSLSAAFASQKVFPKYCSQVLNAGENSGILNKLLYEIGEHIKLDGDIQNGVKSSLFLPKVVFTMLGIAMVIIFTEVIPKYQEVYQSMNLELPLLTQIVFDIYQFVCHHFVFVVLGLCLLIGYIVRFFKSNPDKIDAIKLTIPLYRNLYKKIIQYRFCKCLALFLSARTSAPDALRYTGEAINNAVAFKILDNAAQLVLDGVPLSDAIKESNRPKIIDNMPINFLITGQETGNVVDILSEGANHYQSLINLEMKDFASRVSTALLIPTAAFELIILLSILLPTYTMALGVQ